VSASEIGLALPTIAAARCRWARRRARTCLQTSVVETLRGDPCAHGEEMSGRLSRSQAGVTMCRWVMANWVAPCRRSPSSPELNARLIRRRWRALACGVRIHTHLAERSTEERFLLRHERFWPADRWRSWRYRLGPAGEVWYAERDSSQDGEVDRIARARRHRPLPLQKPCGWARGRAGWRTSPRRRSVGSAVNGRQQ